MNNVRYFEFFSRENRNPYIQKLIEFNISQTEGFIYFDGYYYVLNEEFPKRLFFNTTLSEEKQTENGYEYKYQMIEDNFYEVEVYDRIKMENTNVYDETEEDGQKIRICYFPTYKQKIYFKVINSFNNFDDFLKRTSEYFTEEAVEVA